MADETQQWLILLTLNVLLLTALLVEEVVKDMDVEALAKTINREASSERGEVEKNGSTTTRGRMD